MKKLNKETHFIFTLILIALIGLAIRAYGLWLIKTTEQRMIESAILVESN